ncbi:MAG: MBL fold metallo-hydrolase [Candidatus Magasanikbacteria bacterium]|nr:MBL fold metallo-hydrolase [Candidatus Magasanikbacteria bacterium]
MKKFLFIIATCLLVLLAIFVYIKIDSSRPHHFEVTFLNVGQGDSALIQFENGQKMLVDCGANKIVLSALGRHLPFYDRTIDYVLATHPDLDHYGGCVDVLQRYNVKNIIVNGKEKVYDPYWQEWNALMHSEPGANIITMASPTVWIIASDTLQFLSPDPSLPLNVAAADSNNYSIVFKLTHGNETFLFTGDMEVPLENALMGKYCGTKTSCPAIRANVLKVGHHGSDGGSSESFLRFVNPATAVISAGVRNRYGHPALRVIRHLERVGATVLRTDKLGDIVVK